MPLPADTPIFVEFASDTVSVMITPGGVLRFSFHVPNPIPKYIQSISSDILKQELRIADVTNSYSTLHDIFCAYGDALNAYIADIKKYPKAGHEKFAEGLFHAKYSAHKHKADATRARGIIPKLKALQSDLIYTKMLYNANSFEDDKNGFKFTLFSNHSSDVNATVKMYDAINLYIQNTDYFLNANFDDFGSAAQSRNLKSIYDELILLKFKQKRIFDYISGKNSFSLLLEPAKLCDLIPYLEDQYVEPCIRASLDPLYGAIKHIILYSNAADDQKITQIEKLMFEFTKAQFSESDYLLFKNDIDNVINPIRDTLKLLLSNWRKDGAESLNRKSDEPIDDMLYFLLRNGNLSVVQWQKHIYNETASGIEPIPDKEIIETSTLTADELALYAEYDSPMQHPTRCLNR